MFQRDYQQKWTLEVFKIFDRSIRQNIPIYRVADFSGEILISTFYTSELLYINKTDQEIWIIDDIIKKRKRAGKVEYLVSYQGWPAKFNSWVIKDDIVDVAK